ncbi:hypothetical protein E2C01_052219 [Portunus trituberculatus]|uniref:Uncharacterized protein n=1 Tax=Portunus trituberculatus TaxID=210409 RepID=A0A5B7GLA0_PORTR|nr:hypothetical protein [Portunus trituberculatus]
MSVGVSHKAPIPGDQTHVPCVGVGVCPSAPMPGGHSLPCSGLGHVDPGESLPGSLPLIQEASVEAGQLAPVPGGSEVGQGLSAPMPVSQPLFAARSCEDDEEEVPHNQEGVSPFLHFIGQVWAYLHLPSYEAQGKVLPHQPSLTLLQLLMVQAVCEEAQCRSLKELKPCSANFQLSSDWYGWARSFYLPEGASLAPPSVNEELGGLQPVSNPAVSVSSILLTQIKKVCGSMADIASLADQVLVTWAGAASSTEQDLLEFLSALAKANKDILRSAEELCCRLLMLWRQAVVDSLPCIFSDREKCQLLSSPFSDMLFDPPVVARVQDNEHLASQQCALSSVVRGLASSFRGSACVPCGSKIKGQTRRGAFPSASLLACPQALHYSGGGLLSSQGFLQWRMPWPG